MATVPLTILAGTLPPGVLYNPQTYFNAIVANMSATVSGGNILWGQIGGAEPPGQLPNNGLWFGNGIGGSHGYWNDWNTDASKYLPIPVLCGQYVNSLLRTTTIACGAVLANRTITTPDASGIMALTTDLTQRLGTQTYTGTSVTVRWNDRRAAWITMSGNTTVIADGTAVDGQMLDIFCENPSGAGAWTVLFAGFELPTGVTGLTVTGVAGQRVINHYQLTWQARIGMLEVVAEGYQVAIGGDTLHPTVVQPVVGDGTEIDINFNINLQGDDSLTVSQFSVVVNGAAATVHDASVTGTQVQVNLNAALKKTDTATIRYTGTELKGVNGMAVAAFGPLTISISSGGSGGIHNDPLTGGTGITQAPP